MKLSTIQRTIRLSLITLLSATVVVACGPDKHKHRQPMRTGNKGIDPKTGLPMTPAQTAEQQKKQQEELKSRSAKQQNIEGRIAQAKNGQPTDKNSMGEGTYTLDGVSSYYKYMKSSDDMRVFRDHSIQNTQLKDLQDGYVASGFVASFSDTPRTIEILTKFTVDRSKNQDWAAEASNFLGRVVFRTEVTQNTKEWTHDMLDTLMDVKSQNPDKISIINLLNAGSFNNNAYSLSDGKATVTMRLLKVSETLFKITFDIDESAQPLRARSIVLNYKVEKKTAATPSAQDAAAAAAAGMTPAPQPQATPAPATPAVDNGAAATAPAATPDPAATGAAAATPAGAPTDAVPGVDTDQLQTPAPTR